MRRPKHAAPRLHRAFDGLLRYGLEVRHRQILDVDEAIGELDDRTNILVRLQGRRVWYTVLMAYNFDWLPAPRKASPGEVAEQLLGRRMWAPEKRT